MIAYASKILRDAKRGVHPAALLHRYSITAGQLQALLLVEAQCRELPATLAEGTAREWAPRFRALGHMGLEHVP